MVHDFRSPDLFIIASNFTRFITIYVGAALAAFSIVQYYQVRDHAELRSPPFDPAILPIVRAAGIGSVILCIWSFFMCFLTSQMPGVPLILSGFVDLVFAVKLGLVVGFEGRFVPHSKTECDHVAETSYQVPDGNLSFFQVAAALNITSSTSPTEACKYYVDMWTLGIVSMILVGLSTVFCIGGGARSAARDAPPDRRWREVLKQTGKALWCIAITPFTLFYLGLKLVAGIVLRAVWPVTPFALQRRVIYAYLYGLKVLQLVPRYVVHTPRFLRRLRWRFWRPARAPSSPPALPLHEKGPVATPTEDDRAQHLAGFLIYDILALIAPHLHYTDLVNFSLAARPIRAAIFPNGELAARRERFRVLTCRVGTGLKYACWSCGAQTCGGCSSKRMLSGSHAVAHFLRCQLCCADCFRGTAIPKRPRPDADPCTCLTTAGRDRSRNGGLAAPAVEYHICGGCSTILDQELTESRDKRDNDAAAYMLRQPLSRCGMCGAGLRDKGPRWWVCTRCNRECRSDVHPPWVGQASMLEV